MMKEAVNKLLCLLFPKRCALCGEVICLDEIRCEECTAAHRISGTVCEKCGREEDDCYCAKTKFKPDYNAVAAPYYFDGSMKKGVYRLKKSGYFELSEEMGKEIAACVQERWENVAFDCVSSVPMTKRKEKKRGYNQSELLAQAVARELRLPYEVLLYKPYETPSQRTSGAKERRVNLYGAFEVCGNAEVKGKSILVVDDVKTTGSTLNECAAMLKGAKAKAVYAAAFTVTKSKRKK